MRPEAKEAYSCCTPCARNGTVTCYLHATLHDGRHVQMFVNVETGLLVVDVIDKDEHGGVEVLRRIA